MRGYYQGTQKKIGAGVIHMKTTDFSRHLRSMILGAETKIPLANGQYVTAINFDNAATTPPFISVMNGVVNFAPWYSSIHRGKGFKSKLSSNTYEEGRQIIYDFVNADKEKDTLIFTKNTTESINIAAYRLAKENNKGVIISTDMEHLANDLPWRNKFNVDYVGIDKVGKLSLKDLEDKLSRNKGNVLLVTVTGASNVTGYINPIHEIAKIAHKYHAKIFVDGAQLVPHVPVDMKPHDALEHIDYLAFSAHKMYAPFGVGVLVGPRKTFEKGEPVYKGGGDVRLVSQKFIQWAEPPAKDEAGTPNIMGVNALVDAVKNLNMIGLDAIHQHENMLIHYAVDRLKNIHGIDLYCYDKKEDERVALISFTLEGMPHPLLAEILSREGGIAVRDGMFCAHPYIEKMLDLTDKDIEYYRTNKDVLIPGMVRISFGLYNNVSEVNHLIKLLDNISRNMKSYLSLYKPLMS